MKTDFDKTLAEVLNACPAFVRTYCDEEFAQRGVIKYKGWILRAAMRCRTLVHAGYQVPEDFLKRYPYSYEALGQSGVVPKYRLRGNNTMRELMRVRSFLPELLDTVEKRTILDLSSGPCGIHEVLGFYGHDVMSADHYDVAAPQFRLIYDALGTKPIWFDGRQLPFAFDTNSVDIITCHQAINWYGPYLNWDAHLAELRRICRDKAVVVFNARNQLHLPVRNYISAYCARHPDTTSRICPDTGLPALVIHVRDPDN